MNLIAELFGDEEDAVREDISYLVHHLPRPLARTVDAIQAADSGIQLQSAVVDHFKLREHYRHNYGALVQTKDLTSKETHQLLATLLDRRENDLPDSFVRQIYSKAGGNPKLFLATERVGLPSTPFMANHFPKMLANGAERIKALGRFKPFSVEKNSPCPCNSGIAHRDCCRGLVTH